MEENVFATSRNGHELKDMDQQYIPSLVDAYKRGFANKYAGVKDAPEMKLHYFKVKDDLPRVQVVLGLW